MKNNPETTCVVVLSGGQDSVTCLGIALKNFEKVYAIGFSYAQKHAVELICARKICHKHSVPFVVYEIPALIQMADSALIGGGDVNAKHHANDNLPASFVPNRNALFLTTAHAYAQKVGANYVMTGVCETDYSGYPDCRAEFVNLLEITLNKGYETQIAFITPLMEINKAQTFQLAESVGFLEDVINMTHTCYNGNHTDLHDWGYGCGACPACELRAKGWYQYEQELRGKDEN